MTARVRRWLAAGFVCLVLGTVLFCTGHRNIGPVVLTASLMCLLAAVAHWDAGYQRRRLDRLRAERARRHRT